MDPAHEFQLHTDASDQGISAILTQIRNGQEPVSYASRQLKMAEKKLSFTEKELQAVIFGTKQYRYYLYGRKFTLVTDHRSLCWLLKLEDPSAKLTRWALRLSEFEYTVVHRPGKQYRVPDALSRYIATVASNGPVGRAEVKLGQDSYRFCAKIKANIRRYTDYYLDADGVLYRKETNGRSRLVIPEELFHCIIGDHHKPRYAAHPGLNRTQQGMRRLYYWPSMQRHRRIHPQIRRMRQLEVQTDPGCING
jgi:hypothetical protein